MTQEQIDLIISFHETLERQGPGSDLETKKALKISGLIHKSGLKVLDLGCGTGAQTKVLSENLDGIIYAVDLFQKFLDQLKERLPDSNIKTVLGSMDDLPFDHDSFDLIWSEGAIYNMGFSKGLKYLNPFLKVDGIIAVSEIIWLTEDRPEEIEDYWISEYPEISTVNEKINTMVSSGYELIDYFILPEESWLQNYYGPLEERILNLQPVPQSEDLKKVISGYLHEIQLYKKFKAYFGYGFFIAKKVN